MKKYFPKTKHFKNNKELDKLIKTTKKHPGKTIDLYDELLLEKFLVDSPNVYFLPEAKQKQHFKEYKKTVNQNKNRTNRGTWVHLPWSNTLIHTLNQHEYYKLRTTRNRNLVNETDQKKLYNKKIAIAGLSVGSNILLSFLRYGIGNYYKIADLDTVALSNVNRAFYTMHDVGQNKCEVVTREIHKIDPFIKVEAFTKGVTEKLINQFLIDVDLVVDAFDNFVLKIKLRKLAKQRKIPVISGFDVEEGILLIVERYDTNPNLGTELFLNQYDENLLHNENLTPKQRTNIFVNIIGKEYHSDLMLNSVFNVGKNLTGYPQLIVATLLAASTFTMIAKDILLGKDIPTFRKFISLRELILTKN